MKANYAVRLLVAVVVVIAGTLFHGCASTVQPMKRDVDGGAIAGTPSGSATSDRHVLLESISTDFDIETVAPTDVKSPGFSREDFLVLAQGTVEELHELIQRSPRIAEGASGEEALRIAAQFNGRRSVFEYLVKLGINPAATQQNGVNSLMLAASANPNEHIIAFLIATGVPVNSVTGARMTPLMFARSNENDLVVHTLVRNGADATARDNDGTSVMMHHIAFGLSRWRLERLKAAGGTLDPLVPKESFLLQSVFFSSSYDTRDNVTPLMIAAHWARDPDVLDFVVEHGSNVHARDEFGWTALMYAAASGSRGQLERVERLIRHGAGLEARGQGGLTALMLAAQNADDARVIRSLMSAGTEPNARDNNDVAAIHFAAFGNPTPAITSALVEWGADWTLPGGADRYSPLALAAFGNPNPDVLEVLLNVGADPNSPTTLGMTDFMLVLRLSEDAARVRRLLEYGANPRARLAGTAYDALSVAAMFNSNADVIRTLLEFGADPNAGTNFGFTALMGAAHRNTNPDVVKVLIEAGTDLGVRDDSGRTAWDLIQENAALRNTDVYWYLHDRSFK